MPKKIRYKTSAPDPISEAIASLDKTIIEWDWQKEIRPLIDQVIELKKQEGRIVAGRTDYDPYPGVCGYLQALVTILGSKSPGDVVKWLEDEKTKLETEQPFLILKHSGTK